MGLIRFYKDQSAAIRERDPSLKNSMEILLYPCFRAMFWYRIAHRLYRKKRYFLARFLSIRAARRTGIEIHPGAVIGENFFIDHGMGVVIGETTVIGNNVTVYQGVTLGGTGKEHGKRHPTIEDNVMISAGAKVLGSITVGNNSKIGAGSIVLKDVPSNSTVVGIPGRVVKRRNIRCPQADLDQTSLPDPVADEILRLRTENESLKSSVRHLTEELDSCRSDCYLQRKDKHEDL